MGDKVEGRLLQGMCSIQAWLAILTTFPINIISQYLRPLQHNIFNTHLNILNCSFGFLFLWKSRYHRRSHLYAPTTKPNHLSALATILSFSPVTNFPKAALLFAMGHTLQDCVCVLPLFSLELAIFLSTKY